MDINEVLNKRILVKGANTYSSRSSVEEVKLIEISPSGNWVKVMNMNGNKYWKPLTEVSLVEVLKDITAR